MHFILVSILYIGFPLQQSHGIQQVSLHKGLVMFSRVPTHVHWWKAMPGGVNYALDNFFLLIKAVFLLWIQQWRYLRSSFFFVWSLFTYVAACIMTSSICMPTCFWPHRTGRRSMPVETRCWFPHYAIVCSVCSFDMQQWCISAIYWYECDGTDLQITFLHGSRLSWITIEWKPVWFRLHSLRNSVVRGWFA